MVQLCVDCEFSGISGDLVVSALASLIGTDIMKAYLDKVLVVLKKKEQFSIDFVKKHSHGFEGLFLLIKTSHSDDLNHIHQDFGHKNVEAGQNTHHHQYHVEEMLHDINSALDCFPAPEQAKKLAHTIFSLILNAESEVHGIPPEKVHLHEIGAVDTILDISGTVFGLSQLGLFENGENSNVFFTPVNVGSGTIQTAHGLLPVPAPATAKILEICQIAFKRDDLPVELATPTGVAILGGLKKEGYGYILPSQQILVPEQIGLSVGSKVLPDRANMLRIFVGKPAPNSLKFGHTEPIFTIETNVDDVRGEILGNLIEILISNGALDVNILPSITKKNRPGHLISVVVHEKDVSSVSNLLIEETGTLGVRITPHRRIALAREIQEHQITIDNHQFIIHIKIAKNHEGKVIQRKVEFDDLKNIANSLQKSIRDIEIKVISFLNQNM